MLTFSDLKEEGFGNQHFLLFPQCFQVYQREKVFLAIFNLSSANAFNSVMSKKLSFGKGLMSDRLILLSNILVQLYTELYNCLL